MFEQDVESEVLVSSGPKVSSCMLSHEGASQQRTAYPREAHSPPQSCPVDRGLQRMLSGGESAQFRGLSGISSAASEGKLFPVDAPNADKVKDTAITVNSSMSPQADGFEKDVLAIATASPSTEQTAE